jgi:hypothetical protein
MNKHELKSLLENIYTVLTEEGVPPMLDPNWSPRAPTSPWLSPLSPTGPVAPPPAPPPKLVYPPLTPLEALRGQVINDYDQWIEFFGRWIQLYN